MYQFVRTSAVGRAGAIAVSILIGLALLLSACDLVDNEDDQSEAAEQQTAEQMPAAEAEPQARPAAAMMGPSTLDAATIYAIVRASLALVQTEHGAVTGFVTRSGEILVGASSIAGAAAITATLSNGDVIENIAVAQVDNLADIAVLGPIEPNLARRLPALGLGDGELLPIGSAVYSVGFGRAGAAAGASISAGLLSRRAEWAAAELTMLSTDASIAADQAGLVLVDEMGTVIGIAAASLAERGLFVSTGDIARNLPLAPADAGMAEAETAMEPQSVLVSAVPGERSLVFVTEPDPGPRLTLTISGDQRGMLTITDAADATIDSGTIVGGGAETVIAAELGTSGPYYVWVSTDAEESTRYTVELEQAMGAAPDADDRRWLPEETSSVGLLSGNDDIDTFTLAARPGDVFEVRAESLAADVYLHALGAGVDATDDDGLGGLSGTDAALRIEAGAAGDLQVMVGAIEGSGAGGYVISIDHVVMAPEAAEVSTAAQPAMAMAPSFPAFPDPPTIAMRGSGGEAELSTEAVSRGHDAGDNMLALSDADGSFDVSITILAASGATARVLVSDAASGAIVFESVVTAACAGAEPCIAGGGGNPREAAGGEWLVTIEHGGTGVIEQWQVELLTND